MKPNIIDAGIGVVAADKNDNSKFIAVFIQEALPFYEGEITSDFANIIRKGKLPDGTDFDITLQRGLVVKAEWRGRGNRITSPPVRKGEEVQLYEVKGTDKYFWEELGRSNHLRRREKVIHAFNASNTSVEIDEPPSAKTHYTFSVDGENGHVTLQTSRANNEKSAFTFQINGKDGNATLIDDSGNIIQINTVTKTITLRNSAGSFVQIKDKDIYASAPDLINLKAKRIILDSDTVQVTGNTTFNKNVTVDKNTTVSAKLTAKIGSIESLSGTSISYANHW